ncbi:hypothetical protein [Streptomyces sp. NPDC002573]|uniref:hypothetical protein n=1 Tax=Streptomyces sp. NPDC002573 TaxID=3364651 RepID=UPI0036742A2D
MDATTILAVIGSLVVILGAAARLPTAAAEVVRACITLVLAVSDLRNTVRNAFSGSVTQHSEGGAGTRASRTPDKPEAEDRVGPSIPRTHEDLQRPRHIRSTQRQD